MYCQNSLTWWMQNKIWVIIYEKKAIRWKQLRCMAGCWHLLSHTKPSSWAYRLRARFWHLLQSTGTQVKIQSIVNSVIQSNRQGPTEKISTVEFQTDVLTNSPEKWDSYRELPPKRIRTNLFYITDLAKTLLANISTDDNEAYLKSQITNY